jgi:NADH:ubiquinone oxidoreductase subunit F (NADH-binding)/(2Fe-2S) ferredoxin/formate hydrogenlyase subunit 6/NADH:ubiquinone oxidoreductase subunit I
MQTPFSKPKDFKAYTKELEAKAVKTPHAIYLCAGTGCRAAGALDVAEAIRREIEARKLQDVVTLTCTGCQGFCERGPLCVQGPSGTFYQMLKPEDVKDLVGAAVEKGKVLDRLLYVDPTNGKRIVKEDEIPFYANQRRLVFGLNGRIDPFSIDDYIAHGGYHALVKALGMAPGDVIEEVKRANLRGRGGGGFPAGVKWEVCRGAEAADGGRVIVCNADEGDPGAFMDRSIMEGNPHRVLEGMIIGAWAIGASEAYVFIRHEYPLALQTLIKALEDAGRYGFLGENILGSGLSLKVRINRGGGAFVCGEETGLIASLEGQVGEPRAKFVYPAQKGLWGRPTCINNVETWANVPLILQNGADWFTSIGTEGSKGTKIFSLVGKVNNTGLVEVPMGITLKDLVYKIGGGILKDKAFKAVQTGGPSGGAIPASLLGSTVDFDVLTSIGSMMGSGGMIVMDEETCMVDVARYFTSFLVDESCGKCLSCREGLKQLSWILTDICEGRGKERDIDSLKRFAGMVRVASLCALGGTAANPIMSTLNYFSDEYEEHIKEHVCRALVCKNLITYEIDEDLCTACALCRKECPTEAITGAKNQIHRLDQEKCIKCGACFDVCKYGSVLVRSGKYSRRSEQTKTNLKPVKQKP